MSRIYERVSFSIHKKIYQFKIHNFKYLNPNIIIQNNNIVVTQVAMLNIKIILLLERVDFKFIWPSPYIYLLLLEVIG